MAKKRYDASIPRRMYWSDEIKNRKRCPECDSKLQKEYHTYIIIIKDMDDPEPFITGNDGGNFCPNCPAIVLDDGIFSKIAASADMTSRPLKFMVCGIIDDDAIPPEKSNLPLGYDDNHIPLVEFIPHSDEVDKRKRKRKNRKK